MSRIIVITGNFPVYRDGAPTGRTEFVASHGVDEATGREVVLQCVHPHQLGAVFDAGIQEWVLYN